MMQPEGRPQQSRLKMQKDTCRRDGPTRPGDNAAQGHSQLNELGKMSPGLVAEGVLGQLKTRSEEVAPHELPKT